MPRQMPSAHEPKPVETRGTGLERNGPGAPGAAASVASQAATCVGCQSTMMAPPSEGPLAERLVPKLPSTPSCSPVSRLSSAPTYTLAPWGRLAMEPSGDPLCGLSDTEGGPLGGVGGGRLHGPWGLP